MKNWIYNLKTKHIFLIFLIGILFDLTTTYIGINNGFYETNKLSNYFFQFGIVGFCIVFAYESTFFYSVAYFLKKSEKYNRGLSIKQNQRDYSIIPTIFGIIGLTSIKLYFGFHNLLLILK